LATLAEVAGKEPDTAVLVADLYVAWVGQPTDADIMAAELREALAAAALPSCLRRVTTTVAGNSGAVLHHHFTFRPSSTGLTEERLIRGLHPLIAQRLQLRRLQHFDLTRLPSADEDVYLLRCVAPKNPSDERLVAMAQVRDLTPLRDNEGRIHALPAIEGALAACLDAIRKVQAQRPATKRLDNNRIVLYVWPPSDLTRDELMAVAQRVVPTTAGAGVEEVLFLGCQRDPATRRLIPIAVRITYEVGTGVQ